MKYLKITMSSLIVPLAIVLMSFTMSDTKKVYMEGHDNLKFTVERIEAAPGQTIEITLKTVSNAPKETMAHNFVLLKKDTDVETFATESLSHRDNGYIEPDMEDDIIAQTEMLGGGESDTITFKAPEQTGEYIYICTFPGHYMAGMTGKLIVK